MQYRFRGDQNTQRLAKSLLKFGMKINARSTLPCGLLLSATNAISVADLNTSLDGNLVFGIDQQASISESADDLTLQNETITVVIEHEVVLDGMNSTVIGNDIAGVYAESVEIEETTNNDNNENQAIETIMIDGGTIVIDSAAIVVHDNNTVVVQSINATELEHEVIIEGINSIPIDIGDMFTEIVTDNGSVTNINGTESGNDQHNSGLLAELGYELVETSNMTFANETIVDVVLEDIILEDIMVEAINETADESDTPSESTHSSHLNQCIQLQPKEFEFDFQTSDTSLIRKDYTKI